MVAAACAWMALLAPAAQANPDVDASVPSLWLHNADIKLEAPTHTAILNGSIAQIGDVALVVYRHDGQIGGSQDGEHLMVCELDGNLQPIGPVSMLETRDDLGVRETAEDPRLIAHDNKAFVVYNSTEDGHILTQRSMFLAELDFWGAPGARTFKIVSRKRMTLQGHTTKRIEKNWTPFIKDDALHFIYNTNPPHVFRLDPDMWWAPGSEVALEEVSHSSRKVLEPLGEMRGGTPALYDAEHHVYVTFSHTQLLIGSPGRHAALYFAQMYTFSADPPFDIRGVLPYPLVPELAYRDTSHHLWVVYPTGFLKDGDVAHVSYGQNDRRASRMSLRMSRLFEDLRPPRLEIVRTATRWPH